jgi:thiamine biosynthesis protein ThiI
MERVLLIRYGEISLKGRNRRQFESKLEENIGNAISVLVEDAGKRVSKSHGRFYVTGLQSERLEKECLEVLSCVPGHRSHQPRSGCRKRTGRDQARCYICGRTS